MEQFFVRDPRGRIRTVVASTSQGAIRVFTKQHKKSVVSGDYEVRRADDKLGDWDVYKVRR